MPQQFSEGALLFIFHDDWNIINYDKTTFHQKHFQSFASGSKGVDFIAYNRREKVIWLIEVKDYRINQREKTLDIMDELAIKVKDSLAGLVAMNVNGLNEELTLARKALKGTKIRVILHLEQPRSPSKLYPQVIDPKNIKDRLKSKLHSVDPHPLFCNLSLPLVMRSLEWQVSETM